MVGPHVYGAGSILSTTGGHGDLHSVPLPWMGDLCDSGAELRLADGPAECAKAAREQLRKGARLIKICASGGVFSELDHPIHQQFTLEEIRAVVEVATMADRIVAAHCHGKPGMIAALEAGVRTIEHGTYLDDEVCSAMKETGAILVPTRAIVEEILGSQMARTMSGTRAARCPPPTPRRSPEPTRPGSCSPVAATSSPAAPGCLRRGAPTAESSRCWSRRA